MVHLGYTISSYPAFRRLFFYHKSWKSNEVHMHLFLSLRPLADCWDIPWSLLLFTLEVLLTLDPQEPSNQRYEFSCFYISESSRTGQKTPLLLYIFNVYLLYLKFYLFNFWKKVVKQNLRHSCEKKLKFKMTVFFYKYTKIYPVKEFQDFISQIIQLIISSICSQKHFPLKNREKVLISFSVQCIDFRWCWSIKNAVQHSITL